MSRAAAFFDVDGTIVAGNIVRYYANLRTLDFHPAARALWIGWFALRVPYYLALDARSRSLFQRALYRSYRGLAVADLERRALVHCERYLRPRLFPAAVARMREHQARGEDVVLVTGSLRPIVAPLAVQLGVAELISAEMESRDGAYTGRLVGEPLAAAHKAAAVRACVTRRGLDARTCWAYADSRDDIAMLETVGHAGVVNPDGRLARVAAARGWDILRWSRS